MVKQNLNHDTIFKTYLHSNIDPVDSLWPNSWKEYIHREMKATLDGGLLIMAITNGIYQSMSVVTKVDSVGNIEWEYKIKNDSLGGYPLYSGISLAVLPDSTYIAAYETHEGIWDWSNHIILKKLDKNGNVLKTKSIGNGEENRQPHIRYNPLDTHLYLAYVKEYFGDNSAPGPQENYLKPNIMKLDTEFNIKWNKSYGRAPYYIPNYSAIKYANYGVYDFQLDKKGNMTYLGIVIDHTSLVNHRSLNYLFQLDSNGDSLWFKAYDFPNISGNELTGYGFSQFVQNDDMGFTISTNISTDSFQYGLVFRVDSMGCPDPTCRVAKVVEAEQIKFEIIIYLNPTSDHIILDWQQSNQQFQTLQIYNSTGKLVQRFDAVRAGQALSVEQLSPGIYLMEGITDKGQRFVGKFVKE